ncbi:hypothetical protein [Mesorhizobium sp.]|uniref:hypothetical protein n=1 Tax=Mesorhizobium sp. TaxID=1871066 RepID=UPI0025D6B813|nr:hypothetical protein [Mesorhizobium sp.]
MLPDIKQQFLPSKPSQGIERPEGLIHQQQPRPVAENTRDLDALLPPDSWPG